MPSSSNKIALFVDGATLYATAKTLGFDIDYKRLLKEFQSRGTLLRAFYYIAVIQDGAPDKRASLQNNRRCSRSRQTADALAGWLHRQCRRAGCIAVRGPRATSAPVRRSGSARPRNRGDTAVDARASSVLVLPQTDHHHPLLKCLAREMNPMPLGKLLRRQRWAKVAIALPDDANHFGSQSRPIAAGAPLSAAPGTQRPRVSHAH